MKYIPPCNPSMIDKIVNFDNDLHFDIALEYYKIWRDFSFDSTPKILDDEVLYVKLNYWGQTSEIRGQNLVVEDIRNKLKIIKERNYLFSIDLALADNSIALFVQYYYDCPFLNYKTFTSGFIHKLHFTSENKIGAIEENHSIKEIILVPLELQSVIDL